MERMARELMAIAKSMKCSVHLDVIAFDDGTYGGVLYKIGASAIDWTFVEGSVDFTGVVQDKRHMEPLEDEKERFEG